MNSSLITLHYIPSNKTLVDWKSEEHELQFINVFWIIISLKWFIENWSYFICHHPFFAFWIICLFIIKSCLILEFLRLLAWGMFPDDAIIYIDYYTYFWNNMFIIKILKALTIWIHMSIFLSILIFQTAFKSGNPWSLVKREYIIQGVILVPIILIYILKLQDGNPVIIIVRLLFSTVLFQINVFVFFMFLKQFWQTKQSTLPIDVKTSRLRILVFTYIYCLGYSACEIFSHSKQWTEPDFDKKISIFANAEMANLFFFCIFLSFTDRTKTRAFMIEEEIFIGP